MTEAKHSQLTIHDALRDSLCPRPANGEPDDQTVGACFDRGKCGCQTGAALDAATSLHAGLVAALQEIAGLGPNTLYPSSTPISVARAALASLEEPKP